MTGVVIDPEHGTPEARWADAGLDRLAPFDLPTEGDVLVLAPHPDDEVLAVGGLLQLLARAGRGLRFVAVTDGEASHPGSTATTRAALGQARRHEAAEARRVLGLDHHPVHQVGLPDGLVAENEHALVDLVASLLSPTTTVLAPWRTDGHPDHDAVGRAAATACERSGARLVEYPVWTWNWADPDGSDLPLIRARSVALDATTWATKVAAIEAFASQVRPIGPGAADGPVLPEPTLAHHRRPYEIVFA